MGERKNSHLHHTNGKKVDTNGKCMRKYGSHSCQNAIDKKCGEVCPADSRPADFDVKTNPKPSWCKSHTK